MRSNRIRTEWASVLLTQDDNVIVCLQQNGTPECLWFSSAGELGQAISGKKLCVKKWSVAVPRNHCIIKSVALPASDLAEAAKMMEFELASLVPLPTEELVYACTLIEKHDNTLTVLVYILRLSTLDKILAPYRSRGIEPSSIVPDSLAMQAWFDNELPIASGTSLSAFVDSDRCTLLGSVDGCLQSVDDLAWSADDEDLRYGKLVREVKQHSAELSGRSNHPMTLALGGLEQFTGKLRDELQAGLNAPNTIRYQVHIAPNPCRVCHPFNGQPDRSAKYLYECATTSGLHRLASQMQPPLANLMPADYLRKQQKRLRLKNYSLTTALSVCLVGLLWLLLVTSNWRIQRRLSLIEDEIAPFAKTAGEIENKRQLVNATEGQFANRGMLSQALEELSSCTRNTSVTIHYLLYDAKPNGAALDIKGQANTAATVWDLSDLMQQTKLLRNLGISGTSSQPTQAGQPSKNAFRLQGQIRGK